MRIIKLTREDVEQTVVVAGTSTTLTGTDEHSGELVTVRLSDPGFVGAVISMANRQGSVSMPVNEFQIVSVEPVRGEWDSPGTSPEDGS